MRCVIARVVLVLSAMIGALPAHAAEPGPGAGTPPERILFFLGSDVWQHGKFGYGGFLWSPDGLDNAGFTLKGLVAGGVYDYLSGALGDAQVDGRQIVVAAQPGWRFKNDQWIVTLFAGPELTNNRLTPNDPGSKTAGTHLGASGGVDVWYQPTASWMVALNGSLNDRKSYSARAAFGTLLLDQFFLGPEAQTFGGDDYWQYRLGLQATGVKFGAIEVSLGAGWAEDSDNRSGAYGYLSVLTRQ